MPTLKNFVYPPRKAKLLRSFRASHRKHACIVKLYQMLGVNGVIVDIRTERGYATTTTHKEHGVREAFSLVRRMFNE